ncbi:MAG: DNA repair protein RecN [Chloroflexi bacterium]|nr:DNA repair protein RecN [Chloroflexota bacterium]
MLLELTIRNLAIIDTLRLRAEPGFTALTGETGTGKSIIIDAIALVLGGRATVDVIRTGCDEASVEAVFALEPATRSALAATLADLGEADTGELILRREVSHRRRTSCRLNGHTVTQSALAEVGRHLVDIHGQGEQLSLLQVRRQLELIDRFGGLQSARAALAALVNELRAVRQELNTLNRSERELAQRQDLLAYQVEEISSAHLKPDEDEALRQEHTLLANAAKRQEIAADAYALLSGVKQAGITDQLAQLVQELSALSKLDASLNAEAQLAENTGYQLEDLARTLRTYRDGIENDPQRLQAVEERLELIRTLKRKYGDTIADILAFGERAAQELANLEHSEERQSALHEKEITLLGQMAEAGRSLSEARRLAAARLCELVERELSELGMERARFLVAQTWREDAEGVPIDGKRYACGPNGLDELEFLIAPNPGEDPKPLASSASGGEASRLMLALKNALSTVDPVPTLIFDEIDAGIGGRTGAVVGQKLQRLAETHQVFCVTHLPQIAACAANQIRVSKQVSGKRTLSTLKLLTPQERIEELAVMIGGHATEAARESAAELLRLNAPALANPQTTGASK